MGEGLLPTKLPSQVCSDPDLPLARVGHYAKRLLETVFVHRFSNATMPIMNLFKVLHTSVNYTVQCSAVQCT